MANRDSQIAVLTLHGNDDAKARDSQIAALVLRGNDDTAARVSQIAVLVLHDVAQGIIHGAAEPIWVGGED